MIDHATYLAACERLRRVESGEGLLDVYGVYNAVHDMVDYDKITVYDAEHDETPATVEWLREIGRVTIEPGVELLRFGDWIVVWPWKSGIEVTLFGRQVLTNPTRGQVLTLLRVFKERKV